MAGGELSEMYTGMIRDEAPTPRPARLIVSKGKDVVGSTVLTSQSTTSVNHSQLSSSRGLNDRSKVEDRTANDQCPFHTKTFDRRIASQYTKEAACLESADDIGSQRCKDCTFSAGETEPFLERGQSHSATDEGRVVSKHRRSHGGRDGEKVDSPVVHLNRGRIGRQILWCKKPHVCGWWSGVFVG